MECYSYYGIEQYTFRRFISGFGVDFSYLQSFFNDIFNHVLCSYRSLIRNACKLFYLIDNRAFNILECCFTLTKAQKMEGDNYGHRCFAFGDVNDMRCLRKHAPANYRRLEFEITQMYLSRCQSFIYDIRMHLGRLCCML